MPLRKQQWFQTDKPGCSQRQKRSITVVNDISQTAAQCHLEVTKEGRRERERTKLEGKTA